MLSTLLTYANSVAAIVVVFGLCLLCHELGHFALAKLFGMQVDEFAFGFGRALWKRQRGETTYRLNIFPYGAYVKIAGMEPGAAPTARGFHSRPRWQGAAVIVGGSFANIVLAVVLFTGVVAWTGVPNPDDRGIYVGRVASGGPAEQAGIHAGDEILAVDGQTRSLQIAKVVAGSPAARAGITPGAYVERVGNLEVFVPAELLQALRATPGKEVRIAVVDYRVRDISQQQRLVTLAVPDQLRQDTGRAATAALSQVMGLQFETLGQPALVGYIATRPHQVVTLTVRRGTATIDLRIVTGVANARYAMRDDKGMVYSRIKSVGRIGVVLRPATRPVGFGEAVALGVRQSVGGAATVVESIRLMLHREVEAELAGPVAIMAISVERAKVGWDAVLSWGGLISSILAVMNLLPIPPFDGFRALLLAYESIVRRRVDEQVELVLSIAGFVVIVFMFVVLTFKDVFNLVRYGTP